MIATLAIILVLLIIRVDAMSHVPWRFRVVFLGLIAALSSVWSLHDEDFTGVEWLMLPMLPVLLSLGVATVYPLLPNEIDRFIFVPLDSDSGVFLAGLARFVYLIFLAVVLYAALLTSNILNVAALRTIQLLRVAHSVGFLLTLVLSVLGFLVIYSLHLPWWGNFLAIFALTFPIVLQSVWSINLEERLSREVLLYSTTLALMLSQVALALSFWPVSSFIFSLLLTACLYGGAGAVQYQLAGRPGVAHVRELIVVVAVFLYLTIFTTSWTG